MKKQWIAVTAGIMLAAGAGCTKRSGESAREVPGLTTMHLGSAAKIKGLDPSQAEDLYSGLEVGRAFEGLLQYHYLKRPFELAPNLAAALPEISKDAKVYTFKLKPGTLFHDDPCFEASGGKGRELTAEDVIYTWKRVADPRVLSPGFALLAGLIVGIDDWRDRASRAGKADYAAEIPGLRAVDRYTLRVELTQPSGQFLFYTATPFLSVVAREAVEKYGAEIIRHPVGTGPFRLKEFNPSSRLIWERNPTYRKELYPSEGGAGDKQAGLLEDAGKPLPLVDRIVVDIIVETQPMWLNFMKGQLDMASPPKDSYAEAITLSKELSPELKAKGILLQKEILPDVTFMAFNLRDPVLGKNRKLRQALSLAVDQTEYNRLFYNDRASAAQGPIPPGISGYDPTFKNPYRQFNVGKAKRLLAEAGFPGGKGLEPIRYATMSDSDHRHLSDFIQKAFQEIGVQLKIDTYSWPEFLKVTNEGRTQLAGHAWSADYPDGQNFLSLFYSKNAPPNGNNSAFYSNPEFDRLYEKALLLKDGAPRTALYRQMTHLLAEDTPWIFSAHRHGYFLRQGWLKNFKYHPFEHNRAKYWRIAK